MNWLDLWKIKPLKIASGNFFFKWKFLAIFFEKMSSFWPTFWQSNGNFPEGQVVIVLYSNNNQWTLHWLWHIFFASIHELFCDYDNFVTQIWTKSTVIMNYSRPNEKSVVVMTLFLYRLIKSAVIMT